jgi:tryptophan synthase beta subunit
MRKLLLVAAAGSALAVATALPAAAASGPTSTTFTVSGGALTISVPASAVLGTGAPGTTIGPTTLGAVTVTDSRALLLASWTATVSSTAFTTGGATGPETIPAADATYTTGIPTTTGLILATPTATVDLSGTPQTVVAGTAGIGDNSATWHPTVAVAVPAAAVTGLYTGTITHSVS